MTAHAQHPQAALSEVDELSRLLLETSSARVDVLDREGRLLGINAAGRRMLEATHPEGDAAAGCPWEELWCASSRQAVRRALQRAIAGLEATFEAASASGSETSPKWSVKLMALRDRRGEALRLIATSHVESKHGSRYDPICSSATASPLALAIERAGVAAWRCNVRTGKLLGSEHGLALLGLRSPTPMTYEKLLDVIHADDRARLAAALQRAIEERGEFECEYRTVWRDGSVHWIEAKGRVSDADHETPLWLEGVAQDVTARKAAERTLKASEERFRQLAEAMPHLVCQVATDGRVIYANRHWFEYFRRPSLSLEEWPEVVHSDDIPRAGEAWAALQRGEIGAAAYRLRRHDGCYQWFTSRSVPVFDGDGRLLHVISTNTDIENLKRTEEALRESQSRLATALRAAGMGTWVWHLDTDQLQLDDSLLQLFDCSPDEAAHFSLETWIARAHPDDRGALRAALQQTRECGAELEIEFRLPRNGGPGLWLTAKGRFEGDGSLPARQVLGACMDVTQHKRLEDELRQAQKMEAIGQLAGGVAHDFNNLLMVILGQASLLSACPELSEPAPSAIREITTAAERAAGLTAQLLTFARRQALQVKQLDLNAIVAHTGEMLKRLIDEDVSVTLELDPRVPPLYADATTLTQVLLNLALNARDAMPAGGELTIRTSREQLDEHSPRAAPDARPGDWACLSVSDTGTGIEPEIMPRIFDPFFTTKDVDKGTGLGLAISHGIVERHHGRIAVQSRLGEGTTFRVVLPLDASA